MIASDLGQLQTATVNMVGGDRIFRQGSTIKRVFQVLVNGTGTDISAFSGRVQFRDITNTDLIMDGTFALEPSLGTGYFSVTVTAADTEAVDADEFPFLDEDIVVMGQTMPWKVLTGVYDVEFFVSGSPEVVGCPVDGFWKMRRGVTR